MKLLLDTHALLWWGEDNERLSLGAARAIDSGDHEVFVSAVSAMEIAMKFRLGKLPSAQPLALAFEAETEAMGFLPLPITLTHARVAGSLTITHKDPFDRMLIAQALVEGITLVSNEAIFDGAGISRLW
ncbi:MAG: type II toxin-antitoxin system VapC family toxin [bacterium]|nr:type II toxin-antitoxin system VapC family toxin [bacterium]